MKNGAFPSDRIVKAIDDALAGRATYDIEHRIIRQDDGQVRHIHAHAEVLRNAAGTARSHGRGGAGHHRPLAAKGFPVQYKPLRFETLMTCMEKLMARE